MRGGSLLPPLTSGHGCCLNCPPKLVTMPLDAQPHPGFGALALTRDGRVPDGWREYADEIIERSPWGVVRRGETITLAEIEAAVAEDPDHDWRLRIEGALSDYTYQRHGAGQWVLVEKGMGFA